MSAKKRVFDIGDRVFAKVRGYPAWPARVESAAQGTGSNAKYNVFFYGTYESAICKRDDLFPFNEDTKKRYGKQKRKGFAEGLIEIENNPDIQTAEQIGALVAEGELVAVENAAVEAPQSDAEQPIVEEEEEAALVIDEAKPKRTTTPRNRGSKRKAEESPAVTPVPSKVLKVQKSTPETPTSTPAGAERTSRSGRVIKPKKFVDDEASPPKHAAIDNTVSSKKEDRKMWVQVAATGDIIEINLDKGRPTSFASKEAELHWERNTAKNALKFKEKVESGEILPDEIRKKLEQKSNRTPEEDEILEKEKQMSNRREKVKILKVEQRIVDLGLAIKQALHFKKPDMLNALEILTELENLNVTALMIKKQPDLITTIRRLQKYVGPEIMDNSTYLKEWNLNSEKIRLKANQIYTILQSLFTVPENSNFWKYFEEQVKEFRNATQDMEKSQIMSLISDPTTANA